MVMKIILRYYNNYIHIRYIHFVMPEIYWVGSKYAEYPLLRSEYQKDSVEHIEQLLSADIIPGTKLATTEDLKNAESVSAIQHYGLTREKCTAYYLSDESNSLKGGYNETTKVCGETNSKTGWWVVTPRMLTSDEKKKLLDEQSLVIMGTFSTSQSHSGESSKVDSSKPIPKTLWLGVSLILTMFVALAAWKKWPDEPILSLGVLVILSALCFSVYSSKL